ncbi:MAG TPA: nuclear transport factor 2 family protein [Ilumatobacteraceae bacterium]|nr:nuclear transport factor 2 family protein [Ilumatobacteraceae bacterium]
MNVLLELQRGSTVDQAAILNQLARYAVALDDRDFDTIADLFTEDAQASFSGVRLPPGREAIVKHLRGLLNFAASTHLLGPSAIVVVDDQATAQTPAVAFLYSDADARPSVRSRGIRYSDVFVRQPDAWRIAERVHRVQWMYESNGLPVHPSGPPSQTAPVSSRHAM